MRTGVTLSSLADPDSFFTSPGNEIHIIYEPFFSDDGKSIVLKESGKVNVQDKIEAFRDQTDMAHILARINAGDDSVLRPASELMYGDATRFSFDRREMMQTLIDANNVFDNLSPERKSKFKDFREWFTSAGTQDWVDKMQGVLHTDDSSDVQVNVSSAGSASAVPDGEPVSANAPVVSASDPSNPASEV